MCYIITNLIREINGGVCHHGITVSRVQTPLFHLRRSVKQQNTMIKTEILGRKKAKDMYI
jgi:hypothetical protein